MHKLHATIYSLLQPPLDGKVVLGVGNFPVDTKPYLMQGKRNMADMVWGIGKHAAKQKYRCHCEITQASSVQV